MNTHRIEEINKQIDELKSQMNSVQGTDTEVYARIVGYYRSVGNWNKGKREEFNIRKNFVLGEHSSDCSCTHIRIEKPAVEPTSLNGKILCFIRKTCPNCPPVKAALEESHLPVEYIDVDTNEGMNLAIQYQVMKAPTVLFLDSENQEQSRTSNAFELKSLLTVAV